MIVPSIDLMNGKAVQLREGRELIIDAVDPLVMAKRFALVGEVAVVDLDAAFGRGSNREIIDEILEITPCRVGGGIRDVETARSWLDRGASKVVLGTAAVPEVLKKLPKERVIVALDARDGEVVVDGWRRSTGRTVLSRMKELNGLAAGYLVTFVENEGHLTGLDLSRTRDFVEAAGDARLTIAGGVENAEEIAAADEIGVDVQVGMALYTERIDLAGVLAAMLKSDREDGLFATIIVDERGSALGLAWSNVESLRLALEHRRGVYHSRTRGVWVKGENSSATQDLLRVDLDCDRDALRFTVRQHGAGFCHRGTPTCFGDGPPMAQLERLLGSRVSSSPEGSYTRRLLDDPRLLAAKLREEADELAEAASREHVVSEAADLIYFTLVALARAGVRLADVEREFARRMLRITRRGGKAKPEAGR